MTHSYPKIGEALFTMSGQVKAISKGRPRAGRSGHFFTPKRTRDYERAIKEMAEVFVVDELIACPVRLIVSIQHAIPKSWPKWKTWAAEQNLIYPTVGDLDNKVKAISDALNGIVYLDDSQICDETASQSYGSNELVSVSILRAGYTLDEAKAIYENAHRGSA